MLLGEVDFILKCVAPDMATFQDFVTHLTAAPHVRNVRTSLVLHNSKYEAAVPLG
jgi:DNA-binding Lrp family transcriptional regulator